MQARNTLVPQTGPVAALPAAPGRMVAPAPAGRGPGFAQALKAVQVGAPVTVEAGDTLIGLVRDAARAKGQTVNAAQEYQMAQQVAQANGISDPNRIYTGQTIDLAVLDPALATLAGAGAGRGLPTATNPAFAPARAPVNTHAAAMAASVLQSAARMLTPAQMAMRRDGEVPLARPVQGTVPAAYLPSTGQAHPVLLQTLDRAVAKGFIPPTEKVAVYDKILDMAKNHGFAPDDFARMTLMESDGMNPRASNQRCHGIIQFCDGPARGAASAGFGANPKGILDLSVHKQLSLVDKYFDDVGLKNQGPAGLEDLYLSVLNPASRAQSRPDAPLNIPGPQARSLHVGSDNTAPITRHSIRQGLLQNAAARLGQMLPPSLRQQAQRAQQYVQDSLP